MNILNELQPYIIFVTIYAVLLIVIGFFGLNLANKNPTDVRIVWYLFSLTVVTTSIIAIWASSVGGIDNKGKFQGELGSVINSTLNFMLDLKTDFAVFFSISAIVLLPQIFSYVLSGLFGCASAPIFVGRVIDFLIWSIVKSLVVASGMLLSIVSYGYFCEWSDWNIKSAGSVLIMSGLLLIVSFFALDAYRDFHATMEIPSPKKLPKIQKIVTNLQGWLTRKVPRH